MELGLEWCQGQLTGGSEKGKGVFHGGSWERVHDKLVLLNWADSSSKKGIKELEQPAKLDGSYYLLVRVSTLIPLGSFTLIKWLSGGKEGPGQNMLAR